MKYYRIVLCMLAWHTMSIQPSESATSIAQKVVQEPTQRLVAAVERYIGAYFLDDSATMKELLLKIERLLQQGANPNGLRVSQKIVETEGKSEVVQATKPLIIVAAQQELADLVSLLLRYGANITPQDIKRYRLSAQMQALINNYNQQMRKILHGIGQDLTVERETANLGKPEAEQEATFSANIMSGICNYVTGDCSNAAALPTED